ncbi:hypothetical protein L484_007056 [Morus notabilis]|uniref:Uncharacterized protein n=1 Tax=Morus notabilis TaxID=981085 RepID=W9RTI0_9ROSA|nr:hypothetical protein L484_007056 [Morus notabilis]
MVRWTANKVWVEKQKQRKKRMGVKKECERRCAYPRLLHYHHHLVVEDRLREIRERVVHLQHSLDVIQHRLTAIHRLIIQHQHHQR